MRSNAPSEPLDLERDLPTTSEDVVALRRSSVRRPIDLADYLDFLAGLPSAPVGHVEPRRIEAATEPFSLSD